MMMELFGVLNCKIGAVVPIFLWKSLKIGLTILLCSSIIKEKSKGAKRNESKAQQNNMDRKKKHISF